MRPRRIKICPQFRIPQLTGFLICSFTGLILMILLVTNRHIFVQESDVLEVVDSVNPSLTRERFEDLTSFADISSGYYKVETNTTLCSLQQRANNVAEMCIKTGSQQKLDDDGDDLPNHLLVDDQHGILYCDLSLAASDTWLPLFVLASNPVIAESYNDMPLPVDDHYLLDYGLRRLQTYSNEERRYRLEKYIKFMVVRHPYDRLVAAWRAHEESLSFENFIQKVIKMGSSGHPTWLTFDSCKPCQVKYDYISRVETASIDGKLMKLLLGVDFYNSKTYQLRHRTQKKLQHYKNISDTLMDKINDMYETDAKLFGYQFDHHNLKTSCKFEGKACC